MRRSVALGLVLAGLPAMTGYAACASFGSEDPVTPSSDASPADVVAEVVADGGGDAGEGGSAEAGSTFCADKLESDGYVVCSDFEQTDATNLLARGWDAVDPGNDLVIEPDLIGRGHALHVKVPTLQPLVDQVQALQKDLPVPSTLSAAATLRGGVLPVSQYTEVLSLQTGQDPRDLQLVVELQDDMLTLTESSVAGGVKTEAPLGSIGKLGVVPIRIVLNVSFGTTNTIEVLVDDKPIRTKGPLVTMPATKPTGSVTFKAGYAYTVGKATKAGGSGIYLDDITLKSTP